MFLSMPNCSSTVWLGFRHGWRMLMTNCFLLFDYMLCNFVVPLLYLCCTFVVRCLCVGFGFSRFRGVGLICCLAGVAFVAPRSTPRRCSAYCGRHSSQSLCSTKLRITNSVKPCETMWNPRKILKLYETMEMLFGLENSVCSSVECRGEQVPVRRFEYRAGVVRQTLVIKRLRNSMKWTRTVLYVAWIADPLAKRSHWSHCRVLFFSSWSDTVRCATQCTLAKGSRDECQWPLRPVLGMQLEPPMGNKEGNRTFGSCKDCCKDFCRP